MRRIILAATIALAACTNNSAMVQRDAERIANDVIRYRLDPLTPLDLSKYKEVNYTIVEEKGVRYVYLTVDEYNKLEELFAILGGRIGALQLQVDKYEKGFDNVDGGSPVPNVGVDKPAEVQAGKR